MFDTTRIRQLLKEGLSQAEVARQVGCTRQNVSYIARRGDRSADPHYHAGMKAKSVVTQRDPEFYRTIGREGGLKSAAKRRERSAS